MRTRSVKLLYTLKQSADMEAESYIAAREMEQGFPFDNDARPSIIEHYKAGFLRGVKVSVASV